MALQVPAISVGQGAPTDVDGKVKSLELARKMLVKPLLARNPIVIFAVGEFVLVCGFFCLCLCSVSLWCGVCHIVSLAAFSLRMQLPSMAEKNGIVASARKPTFGRDGDAAATRVLLLGCKGSTGRQAVSAKVGGRSSGSSSSSEGENDKYGDPEAEIRELRVELKRHKNARAGEEEKEEKNMRRSRRKEQQAAKWDDLRVRKKRKKRKWKKKEGTIYGNEVVESCFNFSL